MRAHWYLALSLLIVTPARANLQNELQQCAAIEDSLVRLKCFDELVKGSADELDSDCPIRFELGRAKGTGSVSLAGIICDQFPHVEFAHAYALWKDDHVLVNLGAKNSYHRDSDATMDAEFVRPDGSTFPGGTKELNIDSEEANNLRFKFYFMDKEVSSVRLSLKVVED